MEKLLFFLQVKEKRKFDYKKKICYVKDNTHLQLHIAQLTIVTFSGELDHKNKVTLIIMSLEEGTSRFFFITCYSKIKIIILELSRY